MRVTVLGSGTSHGVPSIGCDCAVCRSSDPRDRRTRPSILIELPGPDDRLRGVGAVAFAGAVRSILVDTSTDLRAQALACNVTAGRRDSLHTHHADHVFGLDDVRRFNQMQGAPIACFGDAATLASLRSMFAYIFNRPRRSAAGFRSSRSFRSAGRSRSAAWTSCRCRCFMAASRCSDSASARSPTSPTATASPTSRGICSPRAAVCVRSSWTRCAIVRHSTHFSVGEAVDVVSRLGTERAYFTHICHDLPHAETCAQLPAGVELAYDGLVLEIA